MQLQAGYSDLSAFAVARKILQTEGPLGFFRGCIPPLWGSMVYRGIMMSAYEAGYTYIEKNYEEDSFLRRELVLGLRPMVRKDRTIPICHDALPRQLHKTKNLF
jgi:Mitochondrial carrier protein